MITSVINVKYLKQKFIVDGYPKWTQFNQVHKNIEVPSFGVRKDLTKDHRVWGQGTKFFRETRSQSSGLVIEEGKVEKETHEPQTDGNIFMMRTESHYSPDKKLSIHIFKLMELNSKSHLNIPCSGFIHRTSWQ